AKLMPAPAATTAGTTPPVQPDTTTASAPPAAGAAPQVKPLNKLFLLTKNSPVYQNPDETSSTIGQVRRKKYVHVTGIAGDYLQIRLKNGTTGFIPVSAAE
ncbi:hypothetical protein, partial [Candidatus Binatus sp.]